MTASLLNFCNKTTFIINEATRAQPNFVRNCLISAIPGVGLTFALKKDYSDSQLLLSCIAYAGILKDAHDIADCISLINTKNCNKLYLYIHFLALVILSTASTPWAISLCAMAALKTLIEIHSSYQVIDKLNNNHEFVVVPAWDHSLPRMRSPNKITNFFAPWIMCGLRTPTDPLISQTLY